MKIILFIIFLSIYVNIVSCDCICELKNVSICGDVNGDGNVTMIDSLLIRNHIFYGYPLKCKIPYCELSNEYNIILLSKNNLNYNSKFSVFCDGSFQKIVTYGDTIIIDDGCNYTIIIHENILDEMGHIENINDIFRNNITYIVYIIVIIMIIGLIIFFIKRK